MKHTTKTYKREIYYLVGDEYTLLEDYRKNGQPMKMKHRKCGNTVAIRRNDFLKGTRCSYCRGNKLNTKIVKERINKETKGEYELLGAYVNAKEKINIKHKKCGNVIKVTYGKFIKSKKCIMCNNRFKKSKEYLQEYLNDNISKEYIVIGEYVNNKNPIKIKHIKCGASFYTRPDYVISCKSNTLCPECHTKYKRKTKTTINKELKHNNSRYIMKDEYINAKTKILFLDLECGKSFMALPNDILRNEAGCPYCRINSIGEELIKNYLENNKINYLQEYKLCKNLKTNNFLRVDFYLEIDNKKYVIEFDGIQHFKPIDYFGGTKAFEKQKINDNIKNEYCKNKNISMIRIPYYEKENIESILEGILSSG